MEHVALIHFLGVRLKLFSPACILKVTNSLPIKSGLLSSSQIPINSRVFLLRIQL